MHNILRDKTTKRLLRAGLLALLLVGFFLPSGAGVAYADHEDGHDDSGGIDGASGALIDVIFQLAEAFIKILVFSSVALFAASIARGTWSAQLANLVGSPMGMSQAWMNIIGGIFTFVIAILSPMVVDLVFNTVVEFAATTIDIPRVGTG